MNDSPLLILWEFRIILLLAACLNILFKVIVVICFEFIRSSKTFPGPTDGN